jgi:hypothetical protein
MDAPMKLTSLTYLKQQNPDWGLYTQSWIYAGIAAMHSRQQRFADLAISDQPGGPVFRDWRGQDPTAWKQWGNVFEGHAFHCFPLHQARDTVIITGKEHAEHHENGNRSLGFDFWDLITQQRYSSAVLWNEVNRTSVSQARYDVVIPVGNLHPHREMMLEILSHYRDLRMVTDDRQDVLETNLRFGDLGLEVWFNKAGIDRFENYRALPLFYDCNENVALDHLPHHDMFAQSRVYCVMESTAFDGVTPYLTEKTWKALAQARPFVIFGDQGCLQKLRDLGFQTWHDFCDEGYDSIRKTRRRAEAAAEAVRQLAEAVYKYPEEIDARCRHNQQWFFDRDRTNQALARFGERCLEFLYQ